MSEARALAALGARLRAAGAPARVSRHASGTHVAAGVDRLRELLSGGCTPGTHAPGPELTPEQLRAYAARYAPENARRALGGSSGWRQRPQCPGCRAFLKHPGAQCGACGFMDGGGYLGVPAKTSHLERWR